MKVKIGNAWYDADHQPLGVQFSDAELACLNQMKPGDGGSNSFAAGRMEGPKEFGVDPLVKWLREGRDEPVVNGTSILVPCGCSVCDSPETCLVAPETKLKMMEGLSAWVESWTTLHWQVEVLYVVDGYQATLEKDGNTVYGPFKADSWIGALYAAQAFTGGKGALEYKP